MELYTKVDGATANRLLNSKDKVIYHHKWMTMIVSRMTITPSKSINHSVSPRGEGSASPRFYTSKGGNIID